MPPITPDRGSELLRKVGDDERKSLEYVAGKTGAAARSRKLTAEDKVQVRAYGCSYSLGKRLRYSGEERPQRHIPDQAIDRAG